MKILAAITVLLLPSCTALTTATAGKEVIVSANGDGVTASVKFPK